MNPQIDASLMDTLIEMVSDIDREQADITQLSETVNGYLETADMQDNLEMMIRQFISLIGLEGLLPDQYARFQPAVNEGMLFILSHIPQARLVQKIVDQMMLPLDVSQGRRMCVLVQDFPSLQKLGQIICRSPGLDPEFKKSLVDLEDNTRTLSYENIEYLIENELKLMAPEFRIIPERHIMSEASVCTVIRASAYQAETEREYPVVLKLVKPSIRSNLSEELDLLNDLAKHLEHESKKLGLEGIAFKDIFNRVRHLLENEVNLSMEQENLDTARVFYYRDPAVTIPEKFNCSTPYMTVMSEVASTKITDTEHLSPKQKRMLVKAVARFCILKPLLDLDEENIFHGDPHAGNIGYWFDGSKPRIVMYDWGMMGKLGWIERFCLALWVTGIVAKSENTIYYAVDIVTKGQVSENWERSANIRAIIKRILSGRKNRYDGIVSVIEEMVEEFVRQGLDFPIDLLMYEKALITLKGVMNDTDAQFNRDDYILWAASQQLLKDLFYMRYQGIVAKKILGLYWKNLIKLWEVQKIVFRAWRSVVLHPFKFPLSE